MYMEVSLGPGKVMQETWESWQYNATRVKIKGPKGCRLLLTRGGDCSKDSFESPALGLEHICHSATESVKGSKIQHRLNGHFTTPFLMVQIKFPDTISNHFGEGWRRGNKAKRLIIYQKVTE